MPIQTILVPGYMYWDGRKFILLPGIATTPSGAAGGDLGGTYPNPTVVGIQGNPVPVPTGIGAVLTYSGTALTWVAGGGSGFTAGGDLTGSSTNQTVHSIQGVVISGAPSVGQVLTATSSTAADWATPSGGSGITQLTGDVTAGPGSGSQSSIVINVHGASVPIAGALTTGNVLQVSGASTLSYAPVNLAGGSNFVTGTLPSSSQQAQTLTGAVGGTTAASTIVLTSNAGITGVLPTANQAAQSLTLLGDATGTGTTASTTTTVGRLQGAIVLSGTPSTGQVLTATSATAADWATPASGFTAGGDLTGTSTNQTVHSIQGVVISGTPSTGQVLTATSSAAADWATPSGGSFTAAGDLSGSSSSQEVVGLLSHALPSLSTGFLEWNGAAWVFGSSGSSVTWADDLSGNGTSTNTAQYVSSLSYSSSAAGGQINIIGTGTTLAFAANNTVASISQTTTASTSGSNLTIAAQTGTGVGNGGGNLVLQAGSSDTGLINGVIEFQYAGASGNLLAVGGGGLLLGNQSVSISGLSGSYTLLRSTFIYTYIALTGAPSGNLTIVFPHSSSLIGTVWVVDATATNLTSGQILSFASNSHTNASITISNSNVNDVVMFIYGAGSPPNGPLVGTIFTP